MLAAQSQTVDELPARDCSGLLFGTFCILHETTDLCILCVKEVSKISCKNIHTFLKNLWLLYWDIYLEDAMCVMNF